MKDKYSRDYIERFNGIDRIGTSVFCAVCMCTVHGKPGNVMNCSY